MRKSVTAGLALALLPGVVWAEILGASGKVEVEYDHAADFTAYKTFAWAPFQGRLDKKITSTSSQSDSPWQQPSDKRTMVSFGKTKVGTLVLELWDGRSKNLVWQARESMPEPAADRMEDAINKSVKRLIGEYPPKPAPAAKE
jgi:hypothetical protein